jgi:hypothetical protein
MSRSNDHWLPYAIHILIFTFPIIAIATSPTWAISQKEQPQPTPPSEVISLTFPEGTGRDIISPCGTSDRTIATGQYSPTSEITTYLITFRAKGNATVQFNPSPFNDWTQVSFFSRRHSNPFSFQSVEVDPNLFPQSFWVTLSTAPCNIDLGTSRIEALSVSVIPSD